MQVVFSVLLMNAAQWEPPVAAPPALGVAFSFSRDETRALSAEKGSGSATGVSGAYVKSGATTIQLVRRAGEGKRVWTWIDGNVHVSEDNAEGRYVLPRFHGLQTYATESAPLAQFCEGTAPVYIAMQVEEGARAPFCVTARLECCIQIENEGQEYQEKWEAASSKTVLVHNEKQEIAPVTVFSYPSTIAQELYLTFLDSHSLKLGNVNGALVRITLSEISDVVKNISQFLKNEKGYFVMSGSGARKEAVLFLYMHTFQNNNHYVQGMGNYPAADEVIDHFDALVTFKTILGDYTPTQKALFNRWNRPSASSSTNDDTNLAWVLQNVPQPILLDEGRDLFSRFSRRVRARIVVEVDDEVSSAERRPEDPEHTTSTFTFLPTSQDGLDAGLVDAQYGAVHEDLVRAAEELESRSKQLLTADAIQKCIWESFRRGDSPSPAFPYSWQSNNSPSTPAVDYMDEDAKKRALYIYGKGGKDDENRTNYDLLRVPSPSSMEHLALGPCFVHRLPHVLAFDVQVGDAGGGGAFDIDKVGLLKQNEYSAVFDIETRNLAAFATKVVRKRMALLQSDTHRWCVEAHRRAPRSPHFFRWRAGDGAVFDSLPRLPPAEHMLPSALYGHVVPGEVALCVARAETSFPEALLLAQRAAGKGEPGGDATVMREYGIRTGIVERAALIGFGDAVCFAGARRDYAPSGDDLAATVYEEAQSVGLMALRLLSCYGRRSKSNCLLDADHAIFRCFPRGADALALLKHCQVLAERVFRDAPTSHSAQKRLRGGDLDAVDRFETALSTLCKVKDWASRSPMPLMPVQAFFSHAETHRLPTSAISAWSPSPLAAQIRAGAHFFAQAVLLARAMWGLSQDSTPASAHAAFLAAAFASRPILAQAARQAVDREGGGADALFAGAAHAAGERGKDGEWAQRRQPLIRMPDMLLRRSARCSLTHVEALGLRISELLHISSQDADDTSRIAEGRWFVPPCGLGDLLPLSCSNAAALEDVSLRAEDLMRETERDNSLPSNAALTMRLVSPQDAHPFMLEIAPGARLGILIAYPRFQEMDLLPWPEGKTDALSFLHYYALAAGKSGASFSSATLSTLQLRRGALLWFTDRFIQLLLLLHVSQKHPTVTSEIVECVLECDADAATSSAVDMACCLAHAVCRSRFVVSHRLAIRHQGKGAHDAVRRSRTSLFGASGRCDRDLGPTPLTLWCAALATL